MNDYVVRINLKTDCSNRNELIDYCLNNVNNDEQCLAIGWVSVYEKNKKIKNYKDFYYAVKKDTRYKRLNPVLNIFWYAKEDDLFWTRDMNGYYWICRVKREAENKCDLEKDIGAILPVEAYKVGMQVPGQIKASFNRPRGGTAEKIKDDDAVVLEYSKYKYNELSGTEYYKVNKNTKGNILDNLPAFDLEELVISYLQITKNYYLLSNSIANKSTTPKIECEFMSRDKNDDKKAVVQVKGPKAEIDALDYTEYVDKNYDVYLYAPKITNLEKIKNVFEIKREDLLSFYKEYRNILPKNITVYENLF